VLQAFCAACRVGPTVLSESSTSLLLTQWLKFVALSGIGVTPWVADPPKKHLADVLLGGNTRVVRC
jgi:hypothetical protein